MLTLRILSPGSSPTSQPIVQISVAVAQASHFQKQLEIKSSKIDKILNIFKHIDLYKISSNGLPFCSQSIISGRRNFGT
jgi:hypothetical protein